MGVQLRVFGQLVGSWPLPPRRRQGRTTLRTMQRTNQAHCGAAPAAASRPRRAMAGVAVGATLCIIPSQDSAVLCPLRVMLMSCRLSHHLRTKLMAGCTRVWRLAAAQALETQLTAVGSLCCTQPQRCSNVAMYKRSRVQEEPGRSLTHLFGVDPLATAWCPRS
jgi:hypothetical protein